MSLRYEDPKRLVRRDLSSRESVTGLLPGRRPGQSSERHPSPLSTVEPLDKSWCVLECGAWRLFTTHGRSLLLSCFTWSFVFDSVYVSCVRWAHWDRMQQEKDGKSGVLHSTTLVCGRNVSSDIAQLRSSRRVVSSGKRECKTV